VRTGRCFAHELRNTLDPETRWIPAGTLPVPVDLDGNELALEGQQLEQFLMNKGFFHVGGEVYNCIGAFKDRRGQYKDEAELPGHRITKGQFIARHHFLPKPMRADVMRAVVFRHRDPTKSLRHLVNDNTDPQRLRAGVPAIGNRRAQPISDSKALAALLRARALADAGDAHRLVVPMAQVQDGDVVAENMLPAFEFSGER
jgi:hypothetical protein